MLINLSMLFLLIFCASFQVSLTEDSSGSKKLRILGAFSHPGKSHFQFFEPLLDELARIGHKITVISFFPKENNIFPNYQDIDLRISEYELNGNFVDLNWVNHLSHFKIIEELQLMNTWSLKHCEQALKNPKVQQLLTSDKEFDLILTEVFNSDCFLSLVGKFRAPFIALSSHEILPWVYHRFHAPYELSYVANELLKSSYYMNFFERLSNVLFFYYANIFYQIANLRPTQKIVNDLVGNVGDLNEIASNVSALLVNTHYSYNGARPLMPNMIEVGGLHLFKEPTKLPQDIQTFLDQAKEGVIYFNLGSRVRTSSMPKAKLEAVIKVLKDLPMKILMKWEEDEFPEQLPNLMVKKWLPQSDILHHPNVVCYVGHGGLLGLSEGLYTGVPMILIPLFADQYYNAQAAAARGGAKVLLFNDINEENFKEALSQVINNPSYKENARMVMIAYKDRPQTPLTTAVWWCEHIGRNKDYNYLKSAASRLLWYQYYLLDVIAVICVIPLILLCIIWRILKHVLSKRKDNFDKKKQQ